MSWNVSSGSVFDWEPCLFSFPEFIPTARLIQLPKEAEMLEVIWRSALIVSLSQFWWNAREGKQTFPWTHDRSTWTSLKKSHNAPLHRRLQTRHRGCRGGFGGSPGSESCTIQLACSAFVLSGWKRWAVQTIYSIYKPEQTQHSHSKLLFLIGLELKNHVSDKQLLQKQRLRIVS